MSSPTHVLTRHKSNKFGIQPGVKYPLLGTLNRRGVDMIKIDVNGRELICTPTKSLILNRGDWKAVERVAL